MRSFLSAAFFRTLAINSLRSLAVFLCVLVELLCPMAAELEIGRDSFTSSMDIWATTIKNRHQQQRAATKQKHKADDQKLLKKVFSSIKAPKQQQPTAKKTCVCAPTSHPGSFRCRLHRNEHSPSEGKDEQRRHGWASNRKRVFSGIGIEINQPRLSRFSISALEETAAETVTVNANDV